MTERKRVGLSRKSINIPAIKTPKINGAGLNIRDMFHNSFGPYIEIVAGDIKTVLRIDAETRHKKEEYNDFMETYFGKKE